MQSPSERVVVARKALGLNQRQFADKIGVSTSLISKIEAGEREVSDKIKRLISLAFDVSYEWLDEGTGSTFLDTAVTPTVNQLTTRYNLTDIEADLLTTYLELSNSDRKAITTFLHNFIDKYLSHRI